MSSNYLQSHSAPAETNCPTDGSTTTQHHTAAAVGGALLLKLKGDIKFTAILQLQPHTDTSLQKLCTAAIATAQQTAASGGSSLVDLGAAINGGSCKL